MSNEEKLLELIDKCDDRDRALTVAIELWHSLSAQLQAEKDTAPETPAKRNETIVA